MHPTSEIRPALRLNDALRSAGFESRPLVAGEHGQPHAKAIDAEIPKWREGKPGRAPKTYELMKQATEGAT